MVALSAAICPKTPPPTAAAGRLLVALAAAALYVPKFWVPFLNNQSVKVYIDRFAWNENLLRCIDCQYHSCLTMFSLRTIHEHGSGTIDSHGESRDHALICRRGNETTVNCIGHWLTRRIKCGLCDGVVSFVELEFHRVARLCGDFLWGE